MSTMKVFGGRSARPSASPALTGRRVMVTGGAGFVGSHIADALVDRKNEVVVVDDLSTGDRANVRAGTDLRVVDVSDARALGRAVEGGHFDAVVHCAAKTKVVQSFEQPELYRRVIVDGTRNVLDAALATGARVFVNLSTGGAIYGETPECAQEDRELHPPSPYGQLKAEAEALVQRESLRGVTLRFANLYGPRQRGDLEGGVIAIFLAAWRSGQRLTVFGDGTAERDYLYVADAVEAVSAALDADVTGVYNIGTGVATSVNALIGLMTELLGPPAGVDHAAQRAGEIQRSCVDSSKAARDGLWAARTSLQDGLKRL